MFCYKCGAQIEDSNIFCTQCGTKLNDIPTNNTNQVVETTHKNKVVKIVVIVFIVLIIAIVGISIHASNVSYLTVDDVKNGVLYGYENETIGEAFEDYFYDCSWNSFVVNGDDDLIDVVEFTGYIYDYNYEKSKVLIQFVHDYSIDDDIDEFEIYCLKINDEYFDEYETGIIIDCIYTDEDCSFMYEDIFTDFE